MISVSFFVARLAVQLNILSLPKDMDADERLNGQEVDISPGPGRRGESSGSMRSSILNKFGSLRLTKKKSYSKCLMSKQLVVLL